LRELLTKPNDQPQHHRD